MVWPKKKSHKKRKSGVLKSSVVQSETRSSISKIHHNDVAKLLSPRSPTVHTWTVTEKLKNQELGAAAVFPEHVWPGCSLVRRWGHGFFKERGLWWGGVQTSLDSDSTRVKQSVDPRGRQVIISQTALDTSYLSYLAAARCRSCLCSLGSQMVN